jgi:tetratricopeptide (TPR) repeat protein
MRDPWKQLVFVGPIALIAFGIHAYTFWRMRYRPPLPESRRENTYQPPQQRRGVFVVTVIGLAAVGIFWGILQVRRNPMAIAADHTLTAVMRWFWPAVIVLLVVFVVLWWLANRDPKLATILNRQTTEDPSELLKEVQTLIDAKPTENRYLARTALQITLKRYDDALASLDAAESLRKVPGSHDATRAAALFQKGEHERALLLMAEVSKRSPDDFIHATNHCTFLAEVGRRDEAFTALDRAEYLFKKFNSPKVWAPLLQSCRDMLEITTGFDVILSPNKEG